MSLIEITEQSGVALAEIEQIPISFTSDGKLLVGPTELEPTEKNSFSTSELLIECPYFKDYDALDGNGPQSWLRAFDLSNWCHFLAHEDRLLAGSILIAFDTDGIDMLEGRNDLAVIWDLRVTPEARRRGIGNGLMKVAEDWAHQMGCSELKVETQDINLPACKFYQRNGFLLREANAGAYPDCPKEMQLIWTKPLMTEET